MSVVAANIEDSRLAMLGEEFTFIMLLSGSWNAITIESTLPLKGAELDLLIRDEAHDGASVSANASICLGSGRCGRFPAFN